MENSAFLEPVDIHGVASCIGAQNVRCYSAPLVLQNLNLTQILSEQKLDVQWSKTLLVEQPVEDSEAKYKAIAKLCRQLAELVNDSVNKQHRFVTIGGDHSCAIGTWSGAAQAVKAQGDFGLIWIDAHMDAHTSTTTPSDAIHGMPVAALLGYGDKRLTEIAFAAPKIKPQNICLLGVRSYEPEEQELLSQLGVKVFFIDEIKARGFGAVFKEAVQLVTQHTSAFGMSLDMDAIDPQDAPGVGSPEQNGINAREMIATFKAFSLPSAFLGFEITELNAFEDKNNKTALLVIELIKALFSRA